MPEKLQIVCLLNEKAKPFTSLLGKQYLQQSAKENSPIKFYSNFLGRVLSTENSWT